MSNKILNENEIVQHVGNTLNIDVSSKVTALNIIKVLSQIEKLADFIETIELKFNYERFRYLTGYQKFIAISNEYKKENTKLDDEQLSKCTSFSSKLYNKTITVFDEVNFLIQNGNDIRSSKVSEYIGLAFMNKLKEIEVLEKIGKREELLRLTMSNKPLLEQKIDEVVKNLTLIKHYPQLAPKRDLKAIELINKLADKKRIAK